MSTTTRITVTGMTCGHCSQAVTQELSALPGVSGVDVDLVAGGGSPVTITSESPLAQEDITEAVSEAGDYSVAF